MSVFLLLFFILSLFGSLATATTIGEEFVSNDSFRKGSVVSVNKDNPQQIQLSTLSNSEYMVGVVSDSGENLVTYAKADSSVTVSLTGEVVVYVIDAGGDISKGDFVGASWLEGVAMKSDSDDKQRQLGIALEDFNSDDAEVYGDIETSEGKKETRIGTIRIRLIDNEGTVNGATDAIDEEGSLEGFLRSISGKSVSFAKIVSVSLIFLTSIIVAGFFVSSSIRDSFVSLGRNPRASSAIYKNLLHVTFVALIVVSIGTALSYVVLVV